MAKIVSTGYVPADADETLLDYLRQETLTSQVQVSDE
jgi:hypothetical protein